jgi:hypothetical protein
MKEHTVKKHSHMSYPHPRPVAMGPSSFAAPAMRNAQSPTAPTLAKNPNVLTLNANTTAAPATFCLLLLLLLLLLLRP